MKLYEIEVQGTTISGLPTDTTWGNSINQLCYVLFGLSLIGLTTQHLIDVTFTLTKYLSILILGDDVILNGLRDIIYGYRETINVTHSDSAVGGQKGLG